MNITPIAYIENAYDTKFAVPRQAMLAPDIKSRIVMEPDYRVPDTFRGLSEFSHVWLIWGFSENRTDPGSESSEARWSPTVRPPRLGGNRKVGVFATRSPFRPNGMGLSCVRLEQIEMDPELGPVLTVMGADLMNGTPIYDIKPYIPYSDAIADAESGFAGTVRYEDLEVEFPEEIEKKLNPEFRTELEEILRQDPRPHYHKDPERIYGFSFDGKEIHFRVNGKILTVLDVEN